MRPIEKFLNSSYYIASIFLITYITWLFKSDTPPFDFNLFNMIGIFILLVIMLLILSFFDNSLYILPVIAGILFVISKHDLSFTTVSQFGFPYIGFILFITGPIIHVFRFKPKLRKGALFKGFLLLSIAYLLPLIYMPFEFSAIPVSMMGVIYLLIYMFLTSTLKGNINYMMKIVFGISMLLSLQLFTIIGIGLVQNSHLSFYDNIYQGIFRSWYINFGWGNINDVAFYIAFTFPSIVYFMFKHPKNYVFWAILFIPFLAVILSGSRGGLIGFAISVIGTAYVITKHMKKPMAKHATIVFFSILALCLINYRLFVQTFLSMINSFDTDLYVLSSYRTYIYKEGIDIFLRYPLFGGGWLSIHSFEFEGRLFMFHSTIIQTIATMGLFGLVALIIHYKEVFTLFFKQHTFEKKIIFVGYLSVQIHGLIDNVMFSLPFMILMILIFSSFENAKLKTLFDKKGQIYLHNGFDH